MRKCTFKVVLSFKNNYCLIADIVSNDPSNILPRCDWSKPIMWPNIPHLKGGRGGGAKKEFEVILFKNWKYCFRRIITGNPTKKTLKRTENLAITFLLGNWDIAATPSVFHPPDCQSAMHWFSLTVCLLPHFYPSCIFSILVLVCLLYQKHQLFL